MEPLTAIHPLAPLRHPIEPLRQPHPKSQDAELLQSCQQFEAILWRSILENTQKPLLASDSNSQEPPPAINFFLNDAISNAVASSPNGLAAHLYRQLAQQLHSTQPSQPSPAQP